MANGGPESGEALSMKKSVSEGQRRCESQRIKLKEPQVAVWVMSIILVKCLSGVYR